MLTLITGISNAGKTTYSKQFDNVLHYDEIMHLPQSARLELYRDADTVEGIFTTVKSRRILLNVTKHDYKVCIWLDTPVNVCKSRPGFKGSARMEPPTYSEGWDEIIRIT